MNRTERHHCVALSTRPIEGVQLSNVSAYLYIYIYVGICRVNLNIYIIVGPSLSMCVCVCVPREELTIEPCKLFVFHAKGQQLYTRGIYMVYVIHSSPMCVCVSVCVCVYIYIIYMYLYLPREDSH